MGALDILKKVSDYDEDGEKIPYEYSFENGETLRKRVHIKSKDEMIILLTLLKYVNESLLGGNDNYPDYENSCNAIMILDDTQQKYIQSNCFMFALVMTELLLSYGFKAKLIICRAADFYRNTDCHCMVQVYIKKYEKWIVVDPSHATMFRDNNGKFLDFPDLRKLIINGESYQIVGGKKEVNEKFREFILEYLAVFVAYRKNAIGEFGTDNLKHGNQNILLLPKVMHTNVTIDNTIITYSEKEFWR